MMSGNLKILGFICLFSFCLGVPPALAQAPTDAPTIIGQIVYQKSGLQESEKRNLQGYFSYKLRSVAGTHRILNAGYFQKNAAYSRCDNGLCMAAMGQDLGVNQVIQTRLTRRGKKCVVQCTVFNVDKKKSERTVVEEGNCSQENLFILVENAVIRVARFNRAAFATEREVPVSDEMEEEEDMGLGQENEGKPKAPEARKLTRAEAASMELVKKAVRLTDRGMHRVAMKTARQALKADPRNIHALSVLGSSACSARRAKDARWVHGQLPKREQLVLQSLCKKNGIKLSPPKAKAAKK